MIKDILENIEQIQNSWNEPQPEPIPQEELQKLEAEQRKQQRISYLKNRLVKLDEDITRAVIGYQVDVVAVKKEFSECYTELCELEGKTPDTIKQPINQL